MSFPTNMSNLKKWIIDHFWLTLAIFLFLTVAVVIFATIFSYCIFLIFNDPSQNCTNVNMTSFVNQNSSDFVGIFVNTMLTLWLIVFSALGLLSSQDALKQLQDEQRIKDIEKRLELFYIHVQNILYAVDKSIELRKKNEDDFKEIISTENFEVIDKLKELGKFKFLAEESTCKSFMKYVFDEDTLSTVVQWTFYGTDAEKYRQDLTSRINSDVNNYLSELSDLKSGKL